MTKTDLKKRVKELIRQSLNAKRIDAMVDKICASGAIDLQSCEDNYRMPKQVVCALSKQLYYDYKPLNDDKKSRRQIENIYSTGL
jgi:hypothetical protein